jgi:pyruvate dehydrogenase E2 component (dihydrolipoamide acetyltransferase)
MATEVIMPKVDMVMETGTFVEWLKQEGESVEKGDALFVISTEKAAIEVDAPADGILAGLSAKPDDVIPVTEVIAYILEPGEELPEKTSPVLDVKPAFDEKHDEKIDESEDLFLSSLSIDEKPRATPLARRMAEDFGIDLNHLTGRGPKGRIHKADVIDYQEALTSDQLGIDGSIEVAPSEPTWMPNLPGARKPGLIPLPQARRKEVIPLSGPRKIIAERMTYSAFSAPHINISLNIDMTDVLRFRQHLQENQTYQNKPGISITAILAYCVAWVLPLHPYLNASLSNEQIILWEDIHLGIAMSINGGLIVPVIRECQHKNVFQLAESLVDLVDRGRNRRLLPAEMSGSTFTISNLGMYDVESFTAVINPPESAILAVGKIVETPIRSNGQIEFKPMMNVTVSADHRVLDGASVAAFLQELKSKMENPFFLAKSIESRA